MDKKGEVLSDNKGNKRKKEEDIWVKEEGLK